ncbi:uncharacterized protein Z518_08764 [Rhinocladiella mackenziei CBS 650.93]|uniref:Thioredoxin domain-containing protein n=1 Tax=Rhinocladiella mackenziei CBS 650.93 TaxID=1442369 RepID=A0A0D2IHP2_9EURO|nr:uncharacterized protein Z518_08764 [Rhinocladiella mackenziei CBS 650.93]KIX02821.1 hypothetical protein Z518_08764 [Rhinocladiella mackenziei CBS 650.93]
MHSTRVLLSAPAKAVQAVSELPLRTTQRVRSFHSSSSLPQQNQNRVLDLFRTPPQFHDALRLCSANNTLLLTLFTTSTCTSCRTITPLLQSLVEKRPSSSEDRYSALAFAELQLDRPGTGAGNMFDLAVEYGVSSMPTLMGFGGRRAERVTERLVDTRVMSDGRRMTTWVDDQMRKGDRFPASSQDGSNGATILTVSPEPHYLADFWTHLTTHDPEFSTTESKKRLSIRLSDMLLKQITLIGAPQVLSALIPLAHRQTGGKGEENRGELDLDQWSDKTFPALHARGIETITSIYGTLWPTIFKTFGPHRSSMGLHELTIVYGLYLSDFTHLSALETELVAFTCITAQGLRGPSLWHVRGLGRVLGARGKDDEIPKMRRIKDVIRGVKVAAMRAVEFCGSEMVVKSRLDGGKDGTQCWPNVGDVVRELGGWGDDE